MHFHPPFPRTDQKSVTASLPLPGLGDFSVEADVKDPGYDDPLQVLWPIRVDGEDVSRAEMQEIFSERFIARLERALVLIAQEEFERDA